MNRKSRSAVQFCLAGFVVALWPFVGALSASFVDSKVMHIRHPDWFEDSSFYDLKAALVDARANGKRGLMVLFTTEGCSYCDLFIRKSLGDPGIASTVQTYFDSVGLEIFDDAEMTGPRGDSMPVKQFATKEGVQFSPTLLFYGDEGKLTLRVVGYQSPERFRMILDYLVGDHYRKVSLNEYRSRVSENASKPEVTSALREDPLFSKPPYMLDRSHFPASQPMLVIFEKAGCSECADFHSDVLALDEVREMLTKFEVVRLDTEDDKTHVRAPDGTRLTPASWFKQAGFAREPALAFFDEKGNEVLSTDALVKRHRMMNSLSYVLERAYEKGWTYQRFARSKAIERRQKAQ